MRLTTGDAAPVELGKQWLKPWNARTGSQSLAMKETFRCPLPLQFQLNVRTIHPNFVAVHPLRRRRPEHLATGDIELGAVPGTSDLVAVELPLCKRAAAMRTRVVDGVEPTVHVKQ